MSEDRTVRQKTSASRSDSKGMAPATPDLSWTVTKLHSLGFTERPLAELTYLARSGNSGVVRSRAARELAIWNMGKGSEHDFRAALMWIDQSRKEEHELSHREKLTTLELLCHFYLKQPGEVVSAFDRASSAGEVSQHAMLVRSNIAPTPERQLSWINRVLDHYGLEPLALLPHEDKPLYDRLTCETTIPRINDGPKVTVLVAAYAASEMLPTALRSILEQTWQNLEIIVLDDCSPTPETLEVAKRFAGTDSRIKVVSMEENGGAYIARSRGLDMASGDYVTLHDADDWSHPRKIEMQVRFLMDNPQVVGCTSQQARADNDLRFTRRTQGHLIIRNTSSFMFRRNEVVDSCGCWDSVRFSADSELIRRITTIFGKRAVKNIPTGPLSLQRNSSSSIIADPALGVSCGHLFGARLQYFNLQSIFHKCALKGSVSTLRYNCNSAKRSFPAPVHMQDKKQECRHYDVVLASDFRFPGGTTSSNAEEIRAQAHAGLRTGLIELYWYGMKKKRGINSKIYDLLKLDNVDLLSYGDEVSCDLLILRQPMALQELQRFIPRISAREIRVIINQTPKLMYSDTSRDEYSLPRVARNMRSMFGKIGRWHPIGPLVRNALSEHHTSELHNIVLDEQNWHNIINIEGWSKASTSRSANCKLRIGRHSRDTSVKWPKDDHDLLSAYPAVDDVEVHILGGAEIPKRMLGRLPENWHVYPFGSKDPCTFLSEIDVWVYFTHPDWIESFGRVIIEAMAVGVPVILPDMYRPLFHDSALYATPQTALETARIIHADTVAYNRQVEKAKAYIRENFSHQTHYRRLRALGVKV